MTVDITVNPRPDAPIAVADTLYMTDIDSFTVNVEGTMVRSWYQFSAPGILVNDSDPDGDAITAVKDTNPDLGLVQSFTGDGSFTYRLSWNNARVGIVDTFTYHVDDGSLGGTPVNVDLVRKVTVNRADFITDGNDWRIRGRTIAALEGLSATAYLMVQGQEDIAIGTDNDIVNGRIAIDVDNSGAVPPDGSRIRVEVNGSSPLVDNATYTGYPVFKLLN
ncbi:MAG: Ig-like domain-containing protein [Candidatus Sedimenticola sp. 6PFRAG1]